LSERNRLVCQEESKEGKRILRCEAYTYRRRPE
jgi:hypothetical protein